MINLDSSSIVVISDDRCQRLQRHHSRGIDHVGVFALQHGLIDRSLKSPLIDHQIRGRDAGNLSRGELQIMRLGPRLRQVADESVITRHPLRYELQRVESGHNAELARSSCLKVARRAGAGARRHQYQWKQAAERAQPSQAN